MSRVISLSSPCAASDPRQTAPRQATRLRTLSRLVTAAALTAVLALTTGCGLTVPTDPQGTLDRVTGGELRVGVSAEPGLADAASDPPRGALPDLVTRFADALDATPAWETASEETLVTMLEQGRLDLAIGGFTGATPWSERVGTTRSYSLGGAEDVVLLTPPGENAFLSELERFLDEEAG